MYIKNSRLQLANFLDWIRMLQKCLKIAPYCGQGLMNRY
ncbi:unnamed protein product [Larinioides sclopetarius]|uniref:Uncharacterized protein n=1 Tax=Larinioides sclopetarius TaxID=280406 RepID=A0AAV2BAZ9_9ARAC